jgi:hypothetical protein
MYDLRDQVRIADIEERHEAGDHDERPDLDDCQWCQRDFDDRAREFRPSRAEQTVTADGDGWVRDWDFIRDEARGK